MAILFIPGKFNAQTWVAELKKVNPILDIRVWPQVGDVKDIDFALVWHYPQGDLLKYPNLKCVSSLGAGVDHIMSDPNLPKNIIITRIVDPLLIRDMSQYVIWAVLHFSRQFYQYLLQQKERTWQPRYPQNDVMVGIMGLGQLGCDLATKLKLLGFKISGWTRSPKTLADVNCFYGTDQFNAFLNQTHILINLLPLTPSTKHILNRTTFYQLPSGAFIINVGRGGHLVDNDLILALDNKQLRGACLDVFHQEPLTPDHPFWSHPNIIVTPHIASVTNPASVAKQVIENYQRLQLGQPLLNQVNLKLGY